MKILAIASALAPAFADAQAPSRNVEAAPLPRQASPIDPESRHDCASPVQVNAQMQALRNVCSHPITVLYCQPSTTCRLGRSAMTYLYLTPGVTPAAAFRHPVRWIACRAPARPEDVRFHADGRLTGVCRSPEAARDRVGSDVSVTSADPAPDPFQLALMEWVTCEGPRSQEMMRRLARAGPTRTPDLSDLFSCDVHYMKLQQVVAGLWPESARAEAETLVRSHQEGIAAAARETFNQYSYE